MSDPSERESARAEHQRALQQFISAARAVPDAAWERSRPDTKWSPAQVAEHLRLSYAIVAQQLAGGTGLRVRTPWWLRAVLRWRVLPRILKGGALPDGARAPREIRPGSGPFDREQTLSALTVSASVAEAAMLREWDDPAARLTHHVFGALRAPVAMRLAAVHTAHHARQLDPRSV
ncbi:MAG: DinB family protein [Gemmatimonadota bacterium]